VPQSIIVSAGQTSSGVVLNSCDRETVLSGGVSVQTTVNSGGFENVSAGGLASATTVTSGGVLGIAGSAQSVFVVSGGQAIVQSGGTANNVTLSGSALGAGANLIQNGDFEDGSLSFWNSAGDVGVAGVPFFGEGTAADGGAFAVFNGGNSAPNGVLSQSFAVIGARNIP
jgi:autotransporter passenger strand-loop-strand repeat protein